MFEQFNQVYILRASAFVSMAIFVSQGYRTDDWRRGPKADRGRCSALSYFGMPHSEATAILAIWFKNRLDHTAAQSGMPVEECVYGSGNIVSV